MVGFGGNVANPVLIFRLDMMQRVTPCTSFIFTRPVSSSVLLPVVPVPEDSSVPGQHGLSRFCCAGTQ